MLLLARIPAQVQDLQVLIHSAVSLHLMLLLARIPELVEDLQVLMKSAVCLLLLMPLAFFLVRDGVMSV